MLKKYQKILPFLLFTPFALSMIACVSVDVGDQGQSCSAYGVCMPGLKCKNGLCEISSEWQDPTTGYIWQKTPPTVTKSWQGAIDYCTGLKLDDISGWHLPTISELRTIIRGCPETETGGACGVEDPGCLDSTNCWDECFGCSGGCYLDSNLAGPCSVYWSSSPHAKFSGFAWFVNFEDGQLDYGQYDKYDVRCVRSGP